MVKYSTLVLPAILLITLCTTSYAQYFQRAGKQLADEPISSSSQLRRNIGLASQSDLSSAPLADPNASRHLSSLSYSGQGQNPLFQASPNSSTLNSLSPNQPLSPQPLIPPGSMLLRQPPYTSINQRVTLVGDGRRVRVYSKKFAQRFPGIYAGDQLLSWPDAFRKLGRWDYQTDRIPDSGVYMTLKLSKDVPGKILVMLKESQRYGPSRKMGVATVDYTTQPLKFPVSDEPILRFVNDDDFRQYRSSDGSFNSGNELPTIAYVDPEGFQRVIYNNDPFLHKISNGFILERLPPYP